tara:strand:- start:104 stop:1069 length:966 start_codon:yes stop_codon:yes gene_type:complete
MKGDIDILQTGKDLINQQLNALIALRDQLGDSFTNVVKLIANSKGRLIIIGLGKSGIIGRKISATLNSTGTASSFIHASDALHGDLGNINTEDIVLFISKSGTTEELQKTIPLVKSMNLKIIAMTGNLNSYLALHADFILDVSIDKEACPNNLAPTTSTTMQLVMGDALSMSLLSLKNFSKEDFAKFHPGGALGKRLSLTVADLYDPTNKPQVSVNDTLKKIILEISSKRLGATAVISNEEIIGIITDGDLRRMLESNLHLEGITPLICMTKNPKMIQKDALIYEAFSIMKKNNITQLLVVEKKKYMGIIHLHDILKHNIF